MAKIEVEHRGLLTKGKFNELKTFFEKEGKFLSEKKRFSIIYTSGNQVEDDKDILIDIKLRITNKKAELAIKHGKWSGKDARKEFNFFIDNEKFEDMIEFLKIISYHHVALMANTKLDYLFNDIEFSLVTVPEWGHYFEAEILTDEKSKDEANKKINKELNKLGLHVLDENGFYKLLNELNDRDGYRLDLDKVDFKEIKKRFSEYF